MTTTAATTTHTAINLPGLNTWIVTVSAESTAELYQHDGWYGLAVDGRSYDLVMWRHTIGRPQHMAALDQALAQVQAAIDSLKPPTPPAAAQPAYAIDYDPILKAYSLTIDGLYHSSHLSYVDAEHAYDAYVYQQLANVSPALRISQLATAYGKAVAEHRLDDAKAIKREAMAVKAQQHGVAFEVFEAEYQAYRMERAA